MAIKNDSEVNSGRRFIRGPEGNAYALLAYAKDFCKQLQTVDPQKYDWVKIETEMTSGDYENLITVFDEYFGDFIDLYR
jgi:hypothetical protein